MDRYQRVEKPRTDAQVNENEIRITAQGRVRNYITYAMALLQEKGSDEIVIKAMGRAINKTVMIAELIKRRIVGLHQNTAIESIDITDVWEPLEEGLLPVETTRHVSMIIITLSKNELDTSLPGYQLPIPASQVKPLVEFEYEGEPLPGVRERGRGGRGRGRGRVAVNNNRVVDYEDGGWDGGRGYNGRGRGRGRGGGFRARGRGYGGGFQESGGYEEFDGPDGPAIQGRGNGNRVANYEDGGWDGGRGFNGRGRGRGRVGGFRGRGRGYNGGFQESGGYDEFGGPDVPAIQGRGRSRGMGRGGRGGYRGGGPVQSNE